MVKLIVATAANRVIGKDNDLIWHLPADMQFFTQSTLNHIVIMGRNNWHSIPDKYRPLKERLNIVVSRNPNFKAEGCQVFKSIEDAIEAYRADPRDIYIIGGGQIYQHCLQHQLVNEMYITKIHHEFEGDTFFPEFNEAEWQKELLFSHPVDDRNAYPFDVWKYTRK